MTRETAADTCHVSLIPAIDTLNGGIVGRQEGGEGWVEGGRKRGKKRIAACNAYLAEPDDL